VKTDFYKYQGAGNDFVIIDNRSGLFPSDKPDQIQRICDRRFGVGADGLILLENSAEADFRMIYFNADGFRGSMCGNGGRCLVAFAHKLGLFDVHTSLEANGSLYKAQIDDKEISLGMLDVDRIENFDAYVFLDTGSPHHVAFTENVSDVDVVGLGRQIRYAKPYGDAGTNVNFVEQKDQATFKVRTYERGVEDETLSCGTGVTAVALASYFLKKTTSERVKIETLGGDLEVDFKYANNRFHDIVLRGPATFVFKGEIEIG
jgi:diaminopimelate epimerase